MSIANKTHELVVVIVNSGFAHKVVLASKKAGAEGGTVINGRGSGINEKGKVFGIPIEPEKEIILIVVSKEKTDQVLTKIDEDIEINKPGKGIMFVLEVEKVIGI